MDTTRVRLCVAAVDRAIAALRDEGASSPAFATLGTAYGKLIETMALGPEPETRACPSCGRLGMRNATVCGYCWTRLMPLPPTGSASTGA